MNTPKSSDMGSNALHKKGQKPLYYINPFSMTKQLSEKNRDWTK
jgi:hypothetical protein